MNFKYRCSNCDGLICETSTCPVCGSRTELVSPEVFWDCDANAPLLSGFSSMETDGKKKIGVDVRPVFPEERLLMEIVLGTPMKYATSSVWNTGNNRYVIDGKKVTVPYSKFLEENSIEFIRDELCKYTDRNKEYIDGFDDSLPVQNFIRINKEHLEEITSEAIEYIQRICENRKLDEIFVSFSGGKDSTVTSSLVCRALGTSKILHFYGDTTLEYPDSYRYVQRFKANNPQTPVLTAKNNEQDFLTMCEVIGPPSRVVRWCCTVFKTGAISQKIEAVFRQKKSIISFQGIRRNESKSRSKYERETDSPKIAKQIAASPIIDWFDSDIWLYLLANQIDFNDAYRKGFTRVGCWCCPNNSEWSHFLAQIYLKDESDKFTSFLYRFARDAGKKDWKEYVDTGKWKARQGGIGVEGSKNVIVKYQPCALEENTLNFELNRPISDQLYELFKPFGTLDFDMGRKRLNEVYVIHRRTKEPILRLSGKKGTKNLKIAVIGKHQAFSSQRMIESLMRAQITKFQSCIACKGCQQACKYGALKVSNLDKNNLSRETIVYRIDESKCIGCLNCVNHFDSGCLMYKVLKTKR